MSDIQIFSEDDYKVFDKIASTQPKSNGVRGWVQVYYDSKIKNKQLESGILHHEGSNLVVAQGRSFVAQKIFDTAGTPDYRGYKISHFSVGAGGATIGANNEVTLLGPFPCDTSVEMPIRLNGTYLNEPSNYVGTPSTLYSYQGAVKEIIKDGSILIENESFSGGTENCSYGTRVKCTCVVPAGEPNALTDGQSVPINEAGLYFVSGTDAKMFAHINFAPKYKELASIFTIVWYILC